LGTATYRQGLSRTKALKIARNWRTRAKGNHASVIRTTNKKPYTYLASTWKGKYKSKKAR